MPYQAPSSSEIKTFLQETRRIAVVGLSDKPYRASYGVSQYMQRQGYEIYGVNPLLTEVLGRPVHPDISALPVKVDLINVFRRSEEVAAIVDEAIAHGAKGLWLQLGVIDEIAAAKAQAAGLLVVMDQCLKIVHGQLCA